ncbi:hypothetical protein LSTR_LSTR016744 [Laodelphax striatellus]|uniref:Uncharacterized protein n=1 Tax=Laodelphax striatellus TaxID=195883 RepID=A0A482WR78_LAOST|nr:hypothetical protein LSTR_LSTR016744 [Laodelphax striatellus]
MECNVFNFRFQPLAVVAWGWAMTMSMVDTDIVQEFISAHALKGPEKLSQDGQYDYLLEKPAAIVTSEDDSTVCPQRSPAF